MLNSSISFSSRMTLLLHLWVNKSLNKSASRLLLIELRIFYSIYLSFQVHNIKLVQFIKLGQFYDRIQEITFGK